MRLIEAIILAFFLLGCVQPAYEVPVETIPNETPSAPSPILNEETPLPPRDVNLTIISSEKGPVFEKVDTKTTKDTQVECALGACTLTFAYYPALEEGQTLRFISTDYNFLNATEVFVEEPQYLILALTTDSVMKNGIFSYAKNDHTYVSNYWATFKKVDNSLPKLEEKSGLSLLENYAVMWNSQFATAGEYYGSGVIFLSQENPYNLSTTIMHELTHSLTDGMNLPTWLNEGVADYYAYRSLGTSHIKTGYEEGLEKWGNPDKEEEYDLSEFHEEFYEPAHTLVQNFAEKYGEEKLRALLQYFSEHPLESPESMEAFLENNQIILDKMSELGGDEKLVSVEYLSNVHLKK
jgi:hypothetical protein